MAGYIVTFLRTFFVVGALLLLSKTQRFCKLINSLFYPYLYMIKLYFLLIFGLIMQIILITVFVFKNTWLVVHLVLSPKTSWFMSIFLKEMKNTSLVVHLVTPLRNYHATKLS